MPTSLKALADPRVARVAPELYRLPSVATRVPLDGKVALQSVRTVTPAPVAPAAPPTRMVPPLFLLLQRPRPTVPRPRPDSTTPAPRGESFTNVELPLPQNWPSPVSLPVWRLLIDFPGYPLGWQQVVGLRRAWVQEGTSQGPRLYSVVVLTVNCDGTFTGYTLSPSLLYERPKILAWDFVGFQPCPGRQPVHPEVPPLVEPERPVPEWIPYLPQWVPALPEVEPETPEEPEEPEEEEEPLPLPLPLPLPALPPPVPEVPAPAPSEKETEKRLAPLPVPLPQIDPRRTPVPVTAPQTQPYPWKVEPQRPVVVPVADPLPRPAPPITLPPTQQPQRQVVPPPATLVVQSVRTVLAQGQTPRLTPEIQSQPETYRREPIRTRTKTDDKDECCCECEQLDCLRIWCQFSPWTPSYYEGEWQEDAYVAKRRQGALVLPGPLQGIANYLNERLSDLKKELCEAIDLVAFIDQQPEPYSDRRRHGPQWKIYWGRSNRTQQSMKVITLPELSRIDTPPEPPPIHDGRVCMHYGIKVVSFWGRIWVGSRSADALESYLRQIYGENVTFTRSDSPGRPYNRGQLKPTRARYWNGERWLPPVRWSPRYWEDGR